jgi:hypothetical protein
MALAVGWPTGPGATGAEACGQLAGAEARGHGPSCSDSAAPRRTRLQGPAPGARCCGSWHQRGALTARRERCNSQEATQLTTRPRRLSLYEGAMYAVQSGMASRRALQRTNRRCILLPWGGGGGAARRKQARGQERVRNSVCASSWPLGEPAGPAARAWGICCRGEQRRRRVWRHTRLRARGQPVVWVGGSFPGPGALCMRGCRKRAGGSVRGRTKEQRIQFNCAQRCRELQPARATKMTAAPVKGARLAAGVWRARRGQGHMPTRGQGLEPSQGQSRAGWPPFWQYLYAGTGRAGRGFWGSGPRGAQAAAASRERAVPGGRGPRAAH